MSAQYGLPTDMASKKGGLAVIAKALNEGDLVRAEIATVAREMKGLIGLGKWMPKLR